MKRNAYVALIELRSAKALLYYFEKLIKQFVSTALMTKNLNLTTHIICNNSNRHLVRRLCVYLSYLDSENLRKNSFALEIEYNNIIRMRIPFSNQLRKTFISFHLLYNIQDCHSLLACLAGESPENRDICRHIAA